MLFLLLVGIFQQAPCQTIWVFEDSDPNYTNPPFEDSLKLFSPQGSLQKTLSGFNISQTAGGWRIINAHTPDGSCWVTDELWHVLKRIGPAGTTLDSIPLRVGALDISSQGILYALGMTGTYYGDSIFMLTPQGTVIERAPYGGVDLVVDSSHSSVWIVGAEIHRLDLNLNHKMSVDSITSSAVSVDYDSNGTVWIADGSQRLLHLAQDGTILDSVFLPTFPSSLRIDRLRSSLWVAASGGVYRYDLVSHALDTVDGNRSFSLDIQQDSGIVWVGGYSALISFASTGQLRTNTLFSASAQKYVSVSQQSITEVAQEKKSEIPAHFRLLQNYPNPFNPATSIDYELPTVSTVDITVFNFLGQKVVTLVNGRQGLGRYTTEFAGTNLPSGVYFYRMRTESFSETRKLVLIN